MKKFFLTPPVDFTPTGSRLLDFALNVIDALEIMVLLALFLCFGKLPE